MSCSPLLTCLSLQIIFNKAERRKDEPGSWGFFSLTKWRLSPSVTNRGGKNDLRCFTRWSNRFLYLKKEQGIFLSPARRVMGLCWWIKRGKFDSLLLHLLKFIKKKRGGWEVGYEAVLRLWLMTETFKVKWINCEVPPPPLPQFRAECTMCACVFSGKCGRRSEKGLYLYIPPRRRSHSV